MRRPTFVRSASRALLVLLMLPCAGLQVYAQSGPPCPWVGPQNYAEESITVSTSSIGFTSASYGSAVAYAFVQVQTDNVYTRETGAPATNTGVIFGPTATSGANFWVCGQAQVQRFRALRVTNDATLRVKYYGN